MGRVTLVPALGSERADKASRMQSQYIRYERRDGRVVPVRVIKQWVTREVPSLDKRKEPTVQRKFITVRVTELRMRGIGDLEQAPEPWCSFPDRVESRERLMTLWQKGDEACEPLVREAGFDQRWLPLGQAPFVGDAYGWSLDNGNGWAP